MNADEPTPSSPEQGDDGVAVPEQRTSRRSLFGMAGASAAGVVAGALVGNRVLPRPGGDEGTDTVYPFFGAHQAGITTPVQDHLHFAAFDLAADATADDLRSLLQDWSYAASRMTQGLDVSASGAVGGSLDAPPDDTGEAVGLSASGLTITIGLGPGVFERDGEDRLGHADRRPAGLADLPPFLGDDLLPTRSGGDLCLQACADDPQVAVHAIRNLSRIAFGRAALRWSQLGFGRTSKTTTGQATPRNLFGFKDGTANVLAEDRAAVDEHVWVGEGDSPDWMTGGSYLVVRTIAMRIETWDRVQLGEQQRIIGRDKSAGAPLSGGEESTEPDFEATADGAPVIDVAAHVRLAHPDNNAGVRLLRRGYNYVDGNNDLGRLDAGLFFLSYQRDVEDFITVQRSLSTDLLNEYVQPVGSAVFAILPGVADGSDWVGSTLLG